MNIEKLIHRRAERHVSDLLECEAEEKLKMKAVKVEMNIIEISVYDGNPATSGPCAWPDTFSGELTDGKISASAERKILTQARKCGEYSKGDRLWLIARDEDGINVAETTIRL
jgi:hypothetical protein